MKKIISFSLFFITILAFSQNKTEEKIWDLLLNNKRKEARELFDKSFTKTKESNFDYLYLDAMISVEEGQMFFDDTFVKSFVKLSPDVSYVYPLISDPFLFGADATGEDMFTNKKIDVLASSEKYTSEDMVLLIKAVYDKLRGDIANSHKFIKRFNAVDKWQFCGVFENLNGSGIDIEYEPETYAKNDKLFDTNTNGKVSWYNQKHYQNMGFHHYFNEQEYYSGIIYAQSFIESPIEQIVFLQLSSSGEFKAFFNDSEIFSTYNKGYNETGGTLLKLKLTKGINRLLLKSELAPTTAIFAKFVDEKEQALTNLKYYNHYKEYNKSKLENLQVEEKEFKYELFFKQKIKENPNHISSKIILLKGYLQSKQNTKANKLLEEFEAKYPKSSFVRMMRIEHNKNTREEEKNNEIIKSIQSDDPDYYFSLFYKVEDQNWFESASIKELEELKDKLSKTKSKVMTLILDVTIAGRKKDIVKTIDKVKELLEASHQNITFMVAFASFFDQIKSPDDNAIIRLEKVLENGDNITVISELLNRYETTKKDEEYKNLLISTLEKFPDRNIYRKKYIQLLTKEQKFDEALKQTQEALDNFPYSPSTLADRGYIYNNMNNKTKAIEYLKKSLAHNPTNIYLMNVIKDINKEEDEIDNVAVKDLYKLIAERRNTKLTGESGATILLDEYIVNVFPEGGYKIRATLIYEITSEHGVEEFKEYYLGYSNNILKTEIVKKNGSIVPAEKSSGSIVFTNLEVGDVIIIQYDGIKRVSGRFYKDFNEASYLNNIYPVVEAIFTVITPENVKYSTYVNNDKVPSKTKKIKNKEYTSWILKNAVPIDNNEYYSKPFLDIRTSVRVGTIKSWGEIANWYANLVSKAMIFDKKTEAAFDEIFPSGATDLSQEEISEKIYNYIQKNIKYSYMDFRQSGYIPQKPSRTLQTKLGDCKDVSTLFVILARKAGLQADLTLVLTNNNAQSVLLLPSMDFNHCIARVKIDNKYVFLELTDKNLPFKAISRGNYKAKALVINQDKADNDNAKLIELSNDNNLENKLNVFADVSINADAKEIKVQHNFYGTSKSHYNDLFSEAYSEKERKDVLEELTGRALDKVISVKFAKVIEGNDLTSNPLVFETEIKISEKPKKIGSMNLLSVPFFSKIYTRDVILNESRKTDIFYIDYESENEYKEEIVLNLPNGSKFMEIPANKKFQYGKRMYELIYNQISPTQLKVIKIAKTSWEDIQVSEYKDFKKFVEDILEAESEIIGYK